ncbi:hypothetical protein evm_009838 [Chilo suppressalis]|nr:hypothetical protein evm_009838 [Chilo suppressalis]
MDHNLEDALNLESAMGGMDFESADVVVSQADISLDTSTQEGDIAMEFEHIEEQPMLMDSGNEEIIVTDFMADQFNLQEYSIHDDQTSGMTTTEDSNQQNILASHRESVDVQFEPRGIAPVRLEVKEKPKYVAIKAAPKKSDTQTLSATREIAIAPKLPKLIPAVSGRFTIPQKTKHVAIAPQPVALITNQNNIVKKIPLSSVLKDGNQGGTVLAQIGKQLVMMPASASGQKIKLVTTGNTGAQTVQYIKTSADHAQLTPAKSFSGIQTNKPVVAKVILQGQSNVDISNQPAVITKLLPTSSASVPQTQTRYIMQRKTVPISVGKRVVMATPTKQGVKFTKKEQNVFHFKTPPKLMPVSTTGAASKVVFTSNTTTSGQNVILKTTSPQKLTQITKDGKVVIQGQKSQFHQVNIPGKGIQYIKLVSNQNPSAAKTVTKLQSSSSNTKSFVISDNKGKLVQVSAAPPPLVFSAADKRPQKLVRIAAAPLTVKATSVAGIQLEALEEYEISETVAEEEEIELNSVDSKGALRSLVANDAAQRDQNEQQLRQRQRQSLEGSDNSNSNSMEHLVPSGRSDDHPLIVISSNYVKQEADSHNRQEDDSTQMDRSNRCIETEILNSYPLSNSPTPANDSEVVTGDLGFKPRRACNCTKSQCLKLYCDCFANGEFCNSCNCNNCHNNLENEELRQKAIRACLERNPNAFRPKIGKTKSGGPDIIRRHNKGCNCKRSGCLKNYCECYEAKIACTAMCKCVGCRNVEEGLQRRHPPAASIYRPPPPPGDLKQPCSFMTMEVIEAVCQCLIAASVEDGSAENAGAATSGPGADADPVRAVIDEFSRCLQDVISASQQAVVPHYEEHA